MKLTIATASKITLDIQTALPTGPAYLVFSRTYTDDVKAAMKTHRKNMDPTDYAIASRYVKADAAFEKKIASASRVLKDSGKIEGLAKTEFWQPQVRVRRTSGVSVNRGTWVLMSLTARQGEAKIKKINGAELTKAKAKTLIAAVEAVVERTAAQKEFKRRAKTLHTAYMKEHRAWEKTKKQDVKAAKESAKEVRKSRPSSWAKSAEGKKVLAEREAQETGLLRAIEKAEGELEARKDKLEAFKKRVSRADSAIRSGKVPSASFINRMLSDAEDREFRNRPSPRPHTKTRMHRQ